MPEPEPKFSETFGFALFCQGLVLFARFFTRLLPGFAWFPLFLPNFAPFLPKNVRFFARFCPVLPGYA